MSKIERPRDLEQTAQRIADQAYETTRGGALARAVRIALPGLTGLFMGMFVASMSDRLWSLLLSLTFAAWWGLDWMAWKRRYEREAERLALEAFAARREAGDL